MPQKAQLKKLITLRFRTDIIFLKRKCLIIRVISMYLYIKIYMYVMLCRIKMFVCKFLGKRSDDPSHPDYVPTIFNFNKRINEKGRQKVDRFNRYKIRKRYYLNSKLFIYLKIFNKCLQNPAISEFYS